MPRIHIKPRFGGVFLCPLLEPINTAAPCILLSHPPKRRVAVVCEAGTNKDGLKKEGGVDR